ncbi:MAG: TetR/AcrR family transcriptional regulator [Hyphomicrobiaceae bacterium]
MGHDDKSEFRGKGRYHHGELRESLIRATRQLVVEKGAENFSLADACRLAGVSTAAPYRHFRDKDEILEEIVARGFDDMAERSGRALLAHGAGTLAGIIAMGQAYVAFAKEETPIFRLMFGQDPVLKKAVEVRAQGQACLAKVIMAVEAYCAANGVKGDASFIAVKLWTFVHGAASLLIDGDYVVVAPEIDVNTMIAAAAPGLLKG